MPKRIRPETIETVEAHKTILRNLGKITDKFPFLFKGLMIASTTNVILHHRKEDAK
jgi:mannose-6-phosphate isomerase class I